MLTMQPPRLSIATLGLVIAIVAADLTWYRINCLGHQSLFGFGQASAFDAGVVPMANIVLIVMLCSRVRDPRSRRWAPGFAVGGIATILGFLVLAWLKPDFIRIWVRPVYLFRSWWGRGALTNFPHYLQAADAVCFLPVQIIIALLCEWLAQRLGWRRNRAAAPPLGESPAGDDSTSQVLSKP